MLLTSASLKIEKQVLFKSQNGICPLCKQKLDSDIQKNHLDHDHALDGEQAGAIRGLLCIRCNPTEGMIKHQFDRSGLAGRGVDYILWLETLLAYLKADYRANNKHPNLIPDKVKKFKNLTKTQMTEVMDLHEFYYTEALTRDMLVVSYRKQLREEIKSL